MENVNLKDEHKPSESLTQRQENESLKSSEQGISSQGFASTSGEEAEGNGSCGKKLVLLTTYKRSTKDVEKARSLGNGSSKRSEREDATDQSNDRTPQNDGQILKKKRIRSEQSAEMSVIDTEEDCVSLKAEVKQIRKETRGLGSDLKQLSNSCMQISEENKFLLAELKQICEPNVIAMLEARNLDKNPQN
ncbi:G-box binding factor bZIP transcription factor [Abeliophyllum distichum]|uniref:G-box binding factor bZIP transcription factor n=1 Tax=Abeliophyllum distichum TaxID=126358 RepID=A0ABD1P8E9_9LAMI